MGGKKNSKKGQRLKSADENDFSLPSELVPHPRYGTRPNYTGIKSVPDSLGLMPSWKYSNERIIPNTGVEAQTSYHCSAFPVPIYFDVLKKCVDCMRHYIFYAREQKYWYEDLGFAIDADCIRCVECRKKQQADEWSHVNYQKLLAKDEKNWEDLCEISTAALDLHRQGRFKSLNRVRGFLNQIPETERHRIRVQNLFAAIVSAEKEMNNSSDQDG